VRARRDDRDDRHPLAQPEPPVATAGTEDESTAVTRGPKGIEVAARVDEHLAPSGQDAVRVLGVGRDRAHGGQHLVRERRLHHELMRERIGDVVDPTLPTAYILPRTERKRLVLNVPEMRLYYYPRPTPGKAKAVHTYPVSIGRMDWATPLGKTQIVEKTRNPSWRPPKSIVSEQATDGEILPEVIPPVS